MFAAVFAIVPALACAGDAAHAVFPPYPDGLASTQGSCVGDPAGPGEGVCSHVIEVWSDARGRATRLVAARFLERMDGGAARWTLTDARPVGAMPKDEHIAIGTCQALGRDEPRIAAQVKHAEAEWLGPVRWAVRLDLQSGRLEDVPAGQVRCLNEGWGL